MDPLPPLLKKIDREILWSVPRIIKQNDAFLKRSHSYGFVNILTKIHPLFHSAIENLLRKMQLLITD